MVASGKARLYLRRQKKALQKQTGMERICDTQQAPQRMRKHVLPTEIKNDKHCDERKSRKTSKRKKKKESKTMRVFILEKR